MNDQDRITQLEAACAAMRAFILGAHHAWVKGAVWSISAEEINQVLSTDAGKSLLDRLQAVEKAHEAIARQLHCVQVDRDRYRAALEKIEQWTAATGSPKASHIAREALQSAKEPKK